MMHFLGRDKGIKFLNNKNMAKSAATVFPKEAAANERIFYDDDGKPRTMGQLYALMESKIASPGI
jgi:hypothetical protein